MKSPTRAEFVILVAAIMMLIALAIDSMLPALPAIGHSLRVTNENRWSLILTAFTAGFGIAQLFMGTISDRYGRRKLLLVSIVIYVVCSIAAAAAATFELLLIARAAQGIGGAGARVLAVSIVRDRFEGRAMAQVMSIASAIFMAAPVVAPFMGTAVLAVAPWRWIFIVLAVVGSMLFVWVALRLPETMAAENRRVISFASILDSARIVFRDAQSVGYTVGTTCLTIGIMGFLTSVQLIFADVLHVPKLLPYGFAVMALTMMAASFANSRIVMRFGMRRISHLALIGFTLLAALHAAVALAGEETLIGFVVLQSLMMACFALTAGNFGAMAMENMGAVAGTASSIQGSFSSIVGAIGGAIIGQSFNGTTFPLYGGIALAGLVALFSIFVAEGGRLLVARHEIVVEA